DEIAEGKDDYESTLRDFYNPFTKDVEAKEDIPKLTDLGPAPDEFPCPECDKKMVYKLGRNGKFMSCSDFPECKGARTVEGEVLEDQSLGKHPETDEEIFVKYGPYGPYVEMKIGETKTGK